jgi:UDP-N-acetylmuramoylalanine--D-glutamate ligase
VRELEGVQYYNDSFGTTPETAMVALQAFVQPKIIILGGSDKGASYDELARSIVANNVRAVLLIGDQADRIQAALEGAGFTAFNKGGETMSEIVSTAHGVAQPGDVVLLSTACASFDMFKDYQDRGEQFKTAVKALA